MWYFLFSVLVEQIAGTNAGGNTLPVGDAAKELAEAEQMMREMRKRNFVQLQTDAERERREAQLCKGVLLELLACYSA